MNLRPTAPPLGFFVVGLGSLGAQRAAACRVARGTRLVAVSDINDQVANRVSSALRVPAIGFRDGLNDPSVHAVAIATPHADHASAIAMALEAGKHVLCEKPLTIDPEDALRLAELAESLGLRLATGFNHRFYPPVRDALDLVAQGQIGKVMQIEATIGHLASPEFLRSWHVDLATSGGGTMMDNGPHACDLVRRFLGDVQVVEARVRDTIGLAPGIESELSARFANDDGRMAEIRSSWTLREGYLTIAIHGDRGNLHIETAPWRLSGTGIDGSPIQRKYVLDRVRDRLTHRIFGCERSLVLELQSFAEGGDAHATGWDGAAATEMVHASYAEAREHGLLHAGRDA